MKKILTLVSLLLVFLQGNAYDYSGAVKEWGRLKLVGNQLCSESGQPIQLRGWSTFGYDGDFGKLYDDQGDFAKMKSYGANFARIAHYVNEFGGYNINWVKNCIDYTAAEGMYCLVDWHILKPGDPNNGQYSRYDEFFREITQYVKGKGYVHVLYEICNEPNDDVEGAPAAFDYVWDWIKDYAYKALPIIASNDPNAVVCVGTPQWDQDVTRAFQSPLEIKDSYKNLQIMYSFHHYAADQQRYLGILSAAAAFVPIFITEWGLSNHDGNGDISTKAGQHMIDVANGKNLGNQIISWANWSWGDKTEKSATWNANWSDRGNYNGMSMTGSGNFVAGVLRNGDQFTSRETSSFKEQVFDGVEDFYLDLGAYDKGGQDNGYFDYDEDWACPGNNKDNENPCNAGDAGKEDNFRPGEYFDVGYVDKNNRETSYKNLGYIGNGEWVSYTIEVKHAGDYEFEILSCNHKSPTDDYDKYSANSYNIFAIAVDGKPGLVTDKGEETRYQALYLPPCKGGAKDDYNTWDWVTPYSGDVDDIEESSNKHPELKYRVRFDQAGKHQISIAFMTSHTGMGSFKIKGNPDVYSSEIENDKVSLWPNPSENGSFNLSVGIDSKVNVFDAQGACVYSGNVEADKTAVISLNLAAGIYNVQVVNEKNISTKKLIVK